MPSFARALFIAAVVMLFGTFAQAYAQAPACAGKNLMAELAVQKPDDFARIMAEGAEETNANAILWKLEKPGQSPSFLFGTMHVTDERLLNVPDQVLTALHGADTVAVENLDVMDQAEAQQEMRALASKMTFTDGSDLREHLDKNEEKTLQQAARKHKLSYFQVIKLKPWMAASLLALPVCEKQRKAAGVPFLDKAIAERANRVGANLVSLETISEQINAMASLPMPAQVAFLASSAVTSLKAGAYGTEELGAMVLAQLDG